jgi:hypothetical protein
VLSLAEGLLSEPPQAANVSKPTAETAMIGFFNRIS